MKKALLIFLVAAAAIAGNEARVVEVCRTETTVTVEVV